MSFSWAFFCLSVDLITEIRLQELFSFVYIVLEKSLCCGFPEVQCWLKSNAGCELFNDCNIYTKVGPGSVSRASRSQSCNQKRRALGSSEDNFPILLMTLSLNTI